MKSFLLPLLVLTLVVPGCTPEDPSGGSPGDGNSSAGGQPGGSTAGGVGVKTLSQTVKERVASGMPRLKTTVPQGKPGEDALKADMARLESGLAFAILQPGAGESPPPNASVKIHITGWLKNGNKLGREFWNSRDDNVALPYHLHRDDLVEGVLQSLRDMKRGERRWIVVPSQLGYGSGGISDGLVPGNADLVLDIELVDFTPES